MLKVLSGVLSVLMVSCVISVQAQAQKLPERVCKPLVKGKGSAYLQHSAKRDSVFDWQAKVQKLYGPGWANYQTAKVIRFPCLRAGWFTQACTVRAQPCRVIKEKHPAT